MYQFITLLDGNITIKEIEQALFVQIILFGWTLIFRVFYDPKHLKFSIVGTKIKRSYIIPNIPQFTHTSLYLQRNTKGEKILSANFDDTMTETTTNSVNNYNTTKSGYLSYSTCDYIMYTTIVVCGLFLLFISVAQFASIHVLYGDCVACILFVILSVIILYKYCYFRLFAYFIHEFRCWMLFLSIIVIYICAVFEIVWKINNTYNIDSDVVIVKEYNSSIFDSNVNRLEWYNHVTQATVYNTAIFLCIARDAMIIPFPHVLSVFLIITLLLTSMYAIFEDTFGYSCILYPNWFLFLQKEAYYQV